MSDDLLGQVTQYVGAAKSVVEMLKAAASLIPKGRDHDEIARKIKEAEDLLARTDAKLAADLGYKLCDCTFPPQIMLWKQSENARVCPNPECGRKISVHPPRTYGPKRRDPNGWLG